MKEKKVFLSILTKVMSTCVACPDCSKEMKLPDKEVLSEILNNPNDMNAFLDWVDSHVHVEKRQRHGKKVKKLLRDFNPRSEETPYMLMKRIGKELGSDKVFRVIETYDFNPKQVLGYYFRVVIEKLIKHQIVEDLASKKNVTSHVKAVQGIISKVNRSYYWAVDDLNCAATIGDKYLRLVIRQWERNLEL